MSRKRHITPKLDPKKDEGKFVVHKTMKYHNGELHLGRIYTYHPTKGWRSRSHKEFKEYVIFSQLSL